MLGVGCIWLLTQAIYSSDLIWVRFSAFGFNLSDSGIFNAILSLDFRSFSANLPIMSLSECLMRLIPQRCTLLWSPLQAVPTRLHGCLGSRLC